MRKKGRVVESARRMFFEWINLGKLLMKSFHLLMAGRMIGF